MKYYADLNGGHIATKDDWLGDYETHKERKELNLWFGYDLENETDYPTDEASILEVLEEVNEDEYLQYEKENKGISILIPMVTPDTQTQKLIEFLSTSIKHQELLVTRHNEIKSINDIEVWVNTNITDQLEIKRKIKDFLSNT